MEKELAQQKSSQRKRPADSPKKPAKKPTPQPESSDSEEPESEESDKVPEEQEEEKESEEDEEPSEAAKNNRLRRLCERKPSGRCHVPDEIHEAWKKGGMERQRLRDQLEECDWQKDWYDNGLCSAYIRFSMHAVM